MTKVSFILKLSFKLLLSSFIYFSCINIYAKTTDGWTRIEPIPINNPSSAGRYIKTYTPDSTISPDSALKYAENNFYKNSANEVYATVTNIHKPIWIYFKTSNFISKDEHLLVLENCNYNFISLYKYDTKNNRLSFISTKGMGVPYQEDNLFPEQISFIVEPNSIYFIETYDFSNSSFPIYIRTNIINTQKSVLLNFFNAYYWGVISVMALIALFFFLRSYEKVFIYYSIFLFGTIVLNLCLDGYLFAYFWPQHPEINVYKYSLYSLSAISTPLFVYYFLDIETYFPNKKYIFIILSCSFILIGLTNVMGFHFTSMYLLQVVALIQIIIYIVYGLKIWQRGNENALYFIVAWSAYLLSILFAILSASDVIPSTSFVNNYVQIGTLIQGTIFSFIIAGKYQQYKMRHIESQGKIIDVLTERELLLTNQNDTLEITVFNRTQELNRTNNELNNLNAKLNELVSQKTWELQKSLEEIVSTNNQLRQFNYITSHNLRGPVSSLKGLIELYLLEDDSTERMIYIEKITLVINRMDEILVDLNKILSYRNTNSIKEQIDFETLISNNLRQLDIRRIHVNLYIDPTLEIHGIKSFYESIFYNLLTNAQKYSHPDRTLKVYIQIARFSDNRFTLTISDNGIGMDESKTGDKLFGFYKRFHTHVEGKGLGLFITKNQIEMLGGTIRAESELDVGTTFIIELPC